MSTNVATIPQPSITAAMAERYGMAVPAFEQTLRATVIPSNASREEFAAFLMVARQYNLNPVTREIYAFPKKGGGIQPIVSIDGWCNLMNSHPAFDGLEFEDHVEKGIVTAITCRIHRKDREHPISATEYLAECHRGTEPWQKWPRRMLRHKALIQAARYAFGFAGIVDPDEAERFTDTREKHTGRSSALGDRLARLAQPRPPTEPTPPQPIPPQPEDDEPPDDPDEEDEGGEFEDEDHNAHLTPEDRAAMSPGALAIRPGKPTPEQMAWAEEQGAPPEIEEERARLTEVARGKAMEGTRKLRFWKARLRPEQEALIEWEPLEEAAKAADEAS